MYEKLSENNNITVPWSDIDKVRFYGIGTIVYSSLTILLHPISVIKTRQQVLRNEGSISANISYFGSLSLSERVRNLYRGLGIVLSVAIPARVFYLTVLEETKNVITNTMLNNKEKVLGFVVPDLGKNSIAAMSGGIAGGLAGFSVQLLVVPVDVISQRQMVGCEGNTLHIFRSILERNGLRGLYRGFGISILNSLPTGTIWWATYTGCQHFFQDVSFGEDKKGSFSEMNFIGARGFVQMASGITAGFLAALLTQPLDVIKTRLQVAENIDTKVRKRSKKSDLSIVTVARDLFVNDGLKAFFRGTFARMLHLGISGTIFSSLYEILKNISKV